MWTVRRFESAPHGLVQHGLSARNFFRAISEKLGIDRILVTCDDDNIGSIRTIEKNGGILENVLSWPDLDKPKRRYWIEAG